MTWTAPRTWVTDEAPTEPIMNTHIRDNQLALMHPYGTRETSTITVASTLLETSIYTTPPVLTGGDLGSSGTFYAMHYYTGDATAGSLTIRIKLGATTVRTITTDGSGSCANGGILDVTVEATGSESSQRIFTRFLLPDAMFTGAGDRGWMDTATVDLTTNQTFNITVQPAVSSGTCKLVSLFRKQMLGRN